jgi:hypothetical protein
MIRPRITEALNKLGWEYVFIGDVIYLTKFKAVISIELDTYMPHLLIHYGNSHYHFAPGIIEDMPIEEFTVNLQYAMRDLILRERGL